MYELSIIISLADSSLEDLELLCKKHKAVYAIVPGQWIIDVPSLPALTAIAARLKSQGVDFRFCQIDGTKTTSWEMTENTLYKLAGCVPSRFSYSELLLLLQQKLSLGPPK